MPTDPTIRNPVRMLIAAALILIANGVTSAWNKPGHMATAAIAYAELKANDPQALQRVAAILRKLPSREYRRAVQRIAAMGFDEELALFVYAARWPDDIRSLESEHRARWHFVNHPFKPPGQPEWVKTYKPPNDNIENAFDHNMDIIGKSSSTAVEKARALCWVFHLTGDAHQPLHSAALFSSVFKTEIGDRGGTNFYVRVNEDDPEAISLHTLWDNSVIGSDRIKSVRDRGTSLSARYRRNAIDDLGEQDIRSWIQESFELAKRNAYKNGSLAGLTRETDAPALPSGYTGDMEPLASKRVATAGYRLADLLSRKF